MAWGAFLPARNDIARTISMYRPRGEQGGLEHGMEWMPTREQRRLALFTLAHEFGHALYWLTDKAKGLVLHEVLVRFNRWKGSGHSIGAWLTEEQRALVFEDEVSAWRLGRVYVAEHLHAAYDARAEAMLADYSSVLCVNESAFRCG